jgi:4-oxalocrotonate tautomerase
MPLVKIDISNNATPGLAQPIGDVVYAAMIEIAKVPQRDKFQIITRRAAEQLIYPSAGYLGIDYTPGIIFYSGFLGGGTSHRCKEGFLPQDSRRSSRPGWRAKAGRFYQFDGFGPGRLVLR